MTSEQVQPQIGALRRTSAESSSSRASLPGAVKISLRAETNDQKERAAISIQMTDPEAVIDKVLEVLAARFPIKAFFSVLANQEATVQATSPASSPGKFNAKVNNAMYNQLLRLSQEESSPINSLNSETMKSWLKDALETLSASDLEEVTTSVSPSASSRLARVLLERARDVPIEAGLDMPSNTGLIRCNRQSTASIIGGGTSAAGSISPGKISVHRSVVEEPPAAPIPEDESAGKWETIDESLLLADRETEHSNGAASLASSHFTDGGDSDYHRQTGLSHWSAPIVESVLQLSAEELSALINGSAPPSDLTQLMKIDDKFSAWVENLLSIRKKITTKSSTTTTTKTVTRTKLNLAAQPAVEGVRVSASDMSTGAVRVPVGMPLNVYAPAVVRQRHDDDEGGHSSHSSHSNRRPVEMPSIHNDSEHSIHVRQTADGELSGRVINAGASPTGFANAINNVKRDSFDWGNFSDIGSQQRRIVPLGGPIASPPVVISNEPIENTSMWLTVVERAVEAERRMIESECVSAISKALEQVRVPHKGIGAIDARAATNFVHQNAHVCSRIVKSVKYAIFKAIQELCERLGFRSAWPQLAFEQLIDASEESRLFTGENALVGRFLAESSVRMAIHGCAEYLTDVCTVNPATNELRELLSIPHEVPSNQRPKALMFVIDSHRREALSNSLNKAVESYNWEVLSGKELLAFVESFFIQQRERSDENIKELPVERKDVHHQVTEIRKMPSSSSRPAHSVGMSVEMSHNTPPPSMARTMMTTHSSTQQQQQQVMTTSSKTSSVVEHTTSTMRGAAHVMKTTATQPLPMMASSPRPATTTTISYKSSPHASSNTHSAQGNVMSTTRVTSQTGHSATASPANSRTSVTYSQSSPTHVQHTRVSSAQGMTTTTGSTTAAANMTATAGANTASWVNASSGTTKFLMPSDTLTRAVSLSRSPGGQTIQMSMQAPVMKGQVYSGGTPLSATHYANREVLKQRDDDMKTTPASASPVKPSFDRAGSPLAALGAQNSESFLSQLHKKHSRIC